ncbi:hypothetical protein BDZ45DRAFT_402011 [Acephala macrosclerotiorum]|nr:hypothetical protein BDZ45DRAFT_402011 [Acephala macrosclerotiorum]
MATSPYHHDFEIPLEGKTPIKCITSSPSSPSNAALPALVFTHGASGTLQSDAILNFRNGFATRSAIACFQGSMNLPSRVKLFKAVIDHESKTAPVTALGGRSMGARAAVMAAKGRGKLRALVLVSYPLHTGKGDVRDEILLEIEEEVKVLLVVGDKDSMCDLERLEGARGKMKAESWRIVVEGADHGMGVKPKVGTKGVGELVGRVVAEWLRDIEEGGLDGQGKEGRIWWDEGEEPIERWSGWEAESRVRETSKLNEIAKKNEVAKSEKATNRGKRSKDKQPVLSEAVEHEESPKEAANKRSKRSRNASRGDEEPEKPTRKRRKTQDSSI